MTKSTIIVEKFNPFLIKVTSKFNTTLLSLY